MTKTPDAGLDVLYEDNHLLAVHKPAGLLSQAGVQGDDTVVERVREYLRATYNKPGNVYVGLVHRLDRNVSGVMLLARTSKAASRLSDAFRRRDVDKRYLAVVEGQAPPTGQLVHHLLKTDDHGVRVVDTARDGAQRAELHFTRLASSPRHALLEVELITGRKHQVRAQLAAHGLPLVGDIRYGVSDRVGRPALHARTLTLTHPVKKTPLALVAPVPADLRGLLERLRLRLPS
ncbi:MAG: 23S rRNA pseudouridine1911/1915/1917 synthase [Myxococcota bacterium]|jgi:23S rRNA pseudouridine1911/1915/1917 synthase